MSVLEKLGVQVKTLQKTALKLEQLFMMANC